uniref:CSON004987 protein n=1 Tax=Culicoides sonorensis TaxID=179676 RepID=A0A336K8F2_CULSO
MLEGWYCRATKAAEDEMGTSNNASSVDNNHGSESYKNKYRELKKKLKYLLYENEFFKESLLQNQQQLMKVSRDRTYLLDRLLKYENPESELSEDESDTSVEDIPAPPPTLGKKRKLGDHIPTNKRPDGAPKRKYTKHKQLAQQQQQQQQQQKQQQMVNISSISSTSANQFLSNSHQGNNPILQDLNLNTEDVQRHLELKQFDTLDNVTMSVPQEMFSSESSNMEDPECLSMGHETVETYMEN